MDFEFTIKDKIYIPEDELNELAEEVREGRPVRDVVNEFISGFDDYDYYHAFAYRDRVIDEVKRRAEA